MEYSRGLIKARAAKNVYRLRFSVAENRTREKIPLRVTSNFRKPQRYFRGVGCNRSMKLVSRGTLFRFHRITPCRTFRIFARS